MPMDYIVLRGEMGNEMFFIQSGVVEVTNSVASEDGTKTKRALKELQYGNFFGEISITMACKRPANVRAKTYCELCLLQRDAESNVHQAFINAASRFSVLSSCPSPNLQRKTIHLSMRRDSRIYSCDVQKIPKFPKPLKEPPIPKRVMDVEHFLESEGAQQWMNWLAEGRSEEDSQVFQELQKAGSGKAVMLDQTASYLHRLLIFQSRSSRQC
jgi:hypothetical protein